MPSNIKHPDHPIWSLIRLAVVNVSVLTAVYMLSGSDYRDLWIILSALGASGLTEFLTFKQIQKVDKDNEINSK
jgi:hypothetical protein